MRRPWPRIVIPVVAVVVLAAVSLAALDLSGNLPGGLVADPTPTPTPTRPLDPDPVTAGDVLPGEPQPVPSGGTAADLPRLPDRQLDRLLTGADLGPDPGAVVVDLGTGTALLSRDASTERAPASVAKLATGAAALLRLDPDSRLRTRVVAGARPGELVLVGAGDASLSSRRPSGRYFPLRASLPGLADAVVAGLRAGGPEPEPLTVAVDDSLFTGPAQSPDWPATYVGSGVVSPVSALSVDAGRVSPTADAREADPALAAGRDLARLLARRGVTVTGGVARATAPAGAREVGAVESPTVAELVELMLQTSDNDLAESLLRLVAVGSDRPGTFVDGRAVVTEVLDELGVSGPATSLLDGSGLARGSLVAPETLVRLLAVAADGSRPQLWHLLTGMPVAGFTGTLAARFSPGVVAGDAGAGEVRAKTGTLTGVSTLAGTATVDDRPVAFVVMANDVTDTLAARAALDRFAALVAGS